MLLKTRGESDLLENLILAVSAVLIGVISTLLGIGGGSLIVPFLIIVFNTGYAEAVATSLTAMVFLASLGALNYYKRGLVDVKVGVLFQALTVAGAFIGANIVSIIPTGVLKGAFGVFLLYVSYTMFKGKKRSLEGEKTRVKDRFYRKKFTLPDGSTVDFEIPILLSSSLVFTAGVFSGMFGIGGGTILVPVLNLACGFPIHVAVATSTFIISMTALTGAATHYIHGNLNVLLVIPVSIGYVIGSQIGPRLAVRIKGVILRKIFAILLAFASLRIIYSVVLAYSPL